MSVRVGGTGGDPFARIAGRARAVAEAAVLEIAAEGERQVVETLTTGRDERGFVGRVDTGTARSAVRVAPVEWNGRSAVARLAPSGPAADYWPVLEGGRRPGRPVSRVGRERIAVWARRKGVLAKIVQSLLESSTGAKSSLRDRRVWEAVAYREQVAGRTMPEFRGRVTGVSAKRRASLAGRALYLLTRSISRKGTPGLAPFRAAAGKLRAGLARAILERVAARARR